MSSQLKMNNRSFVPSSLSKDTPNFQTDLLNFIRLGNVSNYKQVRLANAISIAANTTHISPVIDMKSNGDFKLAIMAKLAANTGNAGKVNQQCVIQTSLNGTDWYDKNIPVNIFVDSSNTPIVNDVFDVPNRFIRVRWENNDNSARVLIMSAEINIDGLSDLDF